MRRACLGLLLALAAGPAATAEPVLDRVVMVSRHGVRSPIRPIETLEALTKRSWPRWPVGPGEMTAHGARNLAFMADFLRDTYRAKGLLPAAGCPPNGALDIWSDSADRRTRQSGDIFADHLAPGCDVDARHAGVGTPDPLFDAAFSKACPIGFLERAASLASAFRRKRMDLDPRERHALEKLQGILAPGACEPNGAGVCLVPEPSASAATADAQLEKAGALAEGLYLEFAQGFPAAEVGWGKAGSEAKIAAVMPAYERGINFIRRNPLVAARRGALLIRTILALLQDRTPPEGAPALSKDAKLVMIAAHDSNLLQAAVLMGLDWRLPGQPVFTPPDATLAFEVWREPTTARRTLRVVIYAQTLPQLRDGTALDAAHPPDVVPIRPEVCPATESDCDIATFAADVERRLATLCNR